MDVLIPESTSRIAKSKTRIELLDSLRFLAIIVVMFHHYFSSKSDIPGIYPYGLKFTYLFKHGNVGVQLFFMISGFVIFMTIERCKTLKEFFIRRLIRLWPLIFLCSIVTFIGMRLLDPNPDFPTLRRDLLAFLPTWTFIDPFLWSNVFGTRVGYVDNVYWSLLVEVKFYIVFGTLYFMNKKNIIFNWLVFTGLITFIYLIDKIYPNNVSHFFVSLDKAMRFGRELVFFTAGIVAFMLFKKRSISTPLSISLIILGILQSYIFLSTVRLFMFFIFIMVFLLFIYKPAYLSFLNFRLFTLIGVTSYPLYLLHNFLGTITINKISYSIGIEGIYSVIVALIVIALFIYLSYILNLYYDNKIQKKLKKLVA